MFLRSSPVAAIFVCLAAASPALLFTLAASPSSAQAVRSHGDLEAEAFVQTQASKVLEVLNDQNLSLGAKKQAFRTLVDDVADVPRITSFVLGRYRRSLTPAQYAAFASAFRTYADSVYETRLGQYRGQLLKVVGSAVRQPGDVVVSSQVGGSGDAPTLVNWRVIRGPDGRYRAVDVQVQGVWLAITEQQDFVSTLDNHNGDINVLIAQLRAQGAGA